MPSERDIPRSLIPLYAEQEKAGDPCRGLSVVHWLDDIAELARATRSTTILDYGCGNAEAYRKRKVQNALEIKDIKLYDPAIQRFSKKPGIQYDGVICCDVLEHVPEHELSEFLKDVIGYAKKFVFFSVCCRPAKRLLPDGQNAHVTIKPFSWWREVVEGSMREGLQWKLREAL